MGGLPPTQTHIVGFASSIAVPLVICRLQVFDSARSANTILSAGLASRSVYVNHMRNSHTSKLVALPKRATIVLLQLLDLSFVASTSNNKLAQVNPPRGVVMETCP